MNWHLLGNCVVVAECVCIVAFLVRVSARALRRISASLLLALSLLATGTGIVAQKTNNVPPNMNQPQMMQGPSFQTGLTGLLGIGNLINLVNPVPATIDDISRGWRVESVTTNAAVSYAMPTNAVLLGNWHVHGATSSCGNNRIDFGDWAFPLGTNDEAFSSFWYFIDGRIRPTPKDAMREICAVGVPMSAVPGQSRLWMAEEPDGVRVLTWEDFFLGGDTNIPINAQIRLYPNGDFTTRSNEVETVCRRVNPDDWDDDGIPNGADSNPMSCDGAFFGPANALPEGANTNAYCAVSVVATGPDALITFVGDAPSDYADPIFIAKSGETNEVVILIGKTYTISSEWPFDVVGASDPETEVWQMRSAAHQTNVRHPVTISASGGNPFTMSVNPSDLGGMFSWDAPSCGCTISGSGDTFSWNCSTTCTCCGTYVDGWYSYEGYLLPATSCACGCWSDGEPEWTGSPGPLLPSVSVSFSKNAVIFEDAYENEPGKWVGRNSTRTRLNVVANGGPNGAVLSVESTNLVKLVSISGPNLPLSTVNVPAETQVSYSIVYEGVEASDEADDIAVRACLQENDSENAFTNECVATSIRLELVAVYEAPENPCTNRHVYGVGEKVRFVHYPESLQVTLSATTGDSAYDFPYYDRFGASNINEVDKHRIYVCPIAANCSPDPTISYGDVSYAPELTLVEPQTVITPEAAWDGCHDFGDVGQSTLVTTNYIGPMTVSFQGIMVAEIPCYVTNAPTGYFATTNFTGFMTHSADAGAGLAHRIQKRNRWTVDHAGGGLYRNWSAGQLTWNIPIGWGRLLSDDYDFKQMLSVEYEMHTNANTRALLIGGRSDLYTQKFQIDENGTAQIDKFGHWLSRSRSCRIMLDGKIVQRIHPLW